MKRLQAYGWPGNVRELRNAIERAMLLAEGDELTDARLSARRRRRSRIGDGVELPAHGIDLEQLERSLVVQALERSGWNQTARRRCWASIAIRSATASRSSSSSVCNRAERNLPGLWSGQKCLREFDESVDVGEVRHEPQRDTHGAGALAVDAQPEVVDRQMRFVLGLMEARRQLGAGDAKRDFAAARVAETSRPQGDARGVRALSTTR